VALCIDLQAFLEAVDMVLEETMVKEVAPLTIKTLQEKINSEVYAVDWPARKYVRKEYNHGLIDPREIEWGYESKTNTLTVKSVRDDWEPTLEKHAGRRVADVVESGDGYDWHSVRPRPFHKPAEDHLILSGEVDYTISRALEAYLGPWSW
jgi:hypothetical protein